MLYLTVLTRCWHRSSWSLSSCVSADKTIAEKHPGAVGNPYQGGYNRRGLTTYGALENWLSGWLDWKLQDTEVELLTTSLDLKVHRRVPVVPFCIITSGSACMSIADVGFVTVNEWGNKIRLLVLAKKKKSYSLLACDWQWELANWQR